MTGKMKFFPLRLYLYEQGFSDKEIAEKVDVHRHTIFDWRKSRMIPPHKSKRGPKRKWTNEELLDILKENPDLSYLEFYAKSREKKDIPSAATIAQRFGSWNKARKKAGLNTNKPKGLNPPSEEEKIKKVKKAMKNGNTKILKKYSKTYLKLTDGFAEETYQKMTGKKLKNKS